VFYADSCFGPVLKKLEWLKAPDPFTNFEIAHNNTTEGTGTWLLELEGFNKWKANGSVFWLKGKGLFHRITLNSFD